MTLSDIFEKRVGEREMINFTVGPVMSNEKVRSIGSEQTPYFRTPEFSEIMFENEKLIAKFAKADEDARVCFLTGSGTAAMEAAVINCFDVRDNVLVIDPGDFSFGHRFVKILEIYDIPHTTIKPEFGCGITAEQLEEYDGKGYTGFLVNTDETSIGVLYDLDIISDFCKRNDIFLIADSISSFLCDPFDMKKLGVHVMIAGSQKALACPPGVSMTVLSKEAVERVYSRRPKTMYLDLKLALKDGERGQTPFTCAVSILRQINQRLKEIDEAGGVDKEIARIKDLAVYFRYSVMDEGFPFEIISKSLSNAVTPLSPSNGVSSYDIFTILKNDYSIWICPNGGELKDKVFRVGHIGDLNKCDFDRLLEAFCDMRDKGILR